MFRVLFHVKQTLDVQPCPDHSHRTNKKPVQDIILNREPYLSAKWMTCTFHVRVKDHRNQAGFLASGSPYYLPLPNEIMFISGNG